MRGGPLSPDANHRPGSLGALPIRTGALLRSTRFHRYKGRRPAEGHNVFRGQRALPRSFLPSQNLPVLMEPDPAKPLAKFKRA
jgi:hypothetical protein